MKYFLIFFIILQVSCSSSQNQLNHIPSQLMDLDQLKELVNDGSSEKYTILYYSASYCPPCKKIKKVLDSDVAKSSFNDIRLIQIDEKDYPESTIHPVWKKYRVRGIPIFIHVDKDLNELNRSGSRNWRKENPRLDKFIKDIWPDKTPEEKKAEEDRRNQNRKRSQLFAAMRRDSNLTNVSQGFYQNEFMKPFEAPYKNYMLRIEKFATFEKLAASDFERCQHLRLHYNFFTPEQQEIVRKAIPKFVNVEYLYFGGDQDIPDEIFQLKKVKYLFLNGSYGIAPLSEKIINFEDLMHIQLGYSYIQLPKNINQLKKLKTIMMPGKGLSQPSELFDLKSLEYLMLNVVSADELKDVKKLTNLRYLETNHFAPEINTLSNLRTLKLSKVTAGDISNLKKLEVLSLYAPPTHEISPSTLALPELAGLFILTPSGLVSFPEKATAEELKYVLISYGNEWPDVKIPSYLKELEHYVEYVRR